MVLLCTVKGKYIRWICAWVTLYISSDFIGPWRLACSKEALWLCYVIYVTLIPNSIRKLAPSETFLLYGDHMFQSSYIACVNTSIIHVVYKYNIIMIILHNHWTSHLLLRVLAWRISYVFGAATSALLFRKLRWIGIGIVATKQVCCTHHANLLLYTIGQVLIEILLIANCEFFIIRNQKNCR